MKLSSPIEELSTSPAYKKRLKRLGIHKVFDLLFHFPYRYDDFSKVTPIAKVKLGKTLCLQGKILEIESRRTFRRGLHLTEALLKDETGAIRVIWFNQPYIEKYLKKGDKVSLAGRITLGEKGLYLNSPAYEKAGKGKTLHTGRLVPVYPETAGLSSKWLRKNIQTLLQKYAEKLPETLPQEILKKENLPPLSKALWQIHFPDSQAEAEKARHRFQFEELFLIQLYVLRERLKLWQERAVALPLNLEYLKKFIASLPFKLTDAQKKSAWQILKDLEKPKPMNRLLEGDVGSGKTVVATIAALNVVKAGYQVAFMAPTEILAKQHFQEVSRLLEDFKVNIGLLTGKEDKMVSKKLKRQIIEISRKKILEKILRGEIDITIGTHALIQEKVKFGKLALVILDEQHRFGVEQRAKLVQGQEGKGPRARKRPIPHLLSMTATPIPRTLALTIYGDLDLSLIDELPKGRKKVITKIVSPEQREEVYQFIREQIKKGRQAFVICPRIEAKSSDSDDNKVQGSQVKELTGKTSREIKQSPERDSSAGKRESERLTPKHRQMLSWTEVKAVKEEYQKLSQDIFPDLKIGMMHGKLALKEKEQIMRDFKNKKIDILVSTSVVEVGIDIPNASVMLIEGAERFGLAQLHQFRGRVGRSHYQSYCFLLTESPSAKTRSRLKALMKAKNSFELAEKDMELRGPGDFLGTRQWGLPDLAMAGLANIPLIERTKSLAQEILKKDPALKKYSQLEKRLEKFQEKVHLE